jgi:dienelactone hydrolase
VGRWHAPRRPPSLTRRPFFGRDDKRLRMELLQLDTEDGQRWDAILYLPPGAAGRRTLARPAVLVVHGSVGNFLSGVPRTISFGLAQAGHPVLSINTRMANYGVFFGGGLFHRTPLDIDPALALLRRRGFDRIVLLGYSMGASMVTNYQEVDRRARELLMPDPERSRNDEIFVVSRARGATDEPRDAEIWTYRTWWHSRGPEAVEAISARRIGAVGVPIGMVQAGADALVMAHEGDELARIALAGSCPDARVSVIEGADHTFTGRDQELVAGCAAWIADAPEASRPARAVA